MLTQVIAKLCLYFFMSFSGLSKVKLTNYLAIKCILRVIEDENYLYCQNI